MHFERARPLRVAAVLVAAVVGLPSSARADWVASGFFGDLWTRSSTVSLALPDRQTAIEIDHVEYRGESFTSPQYYGYRLAWIPDAYPWMGLEVEVIHAKVFAEAARAVRIRGSLRGVPVDATVPLSSIVQRLAMSHGLNFVLANLALRRSLGPVDARGRSRYVAVLRAGLGPTVPHAESTVDHVNRDAWESGGLGGQAAGGLEVALGRGLGLLGEYKFTWAIPQIAVVGGDATIPARSHHVVGGVAYRF